MEIDKLILVALTNSDNMEAAIEVMEAEELKSFIWSNVERYSNGYSDDEDELISPTKDEVDRFVDGCRGREDYLALSSDGCQEIGITIRYLTKDEINKIGG